MDERVVATGRVMLYRTGDKLCFATMRDDLHKSPMSPMSRLSSLRLRSDRPDQSSA